MSGGTTYGLTGSWELGECIHELGEGERDNRLIGGGEEVPETEEVVSTEARILNSLNWRSRDIEFDDRAEVGKSS